MQPASLERLTKIANQLRIHSIRATQAAGSGHPTSCLSAADIVAALFFKVMRYFPLDPKYPNNDRFVLSKGHAAPLLYAAWAEAGLFSTDELVRLRTFESDLEGHPTPRLSFVDVATGSLGQGLSAGVGMALAARLDQLDFRTFVLMGDGEIAEGSVWEAASMASVQKLDNLTAIVDVNRLGQSQPTMFEHDLDVYKARFEAFGWYAIVIDGHKMEEVLAAFEQAEKTKGKPTVLIAKTFKGFGVSFLANKSAWHGKALKKEEMDEAFKELETKAEPAAGVDIPKPSAKKPLTYEQKPEPVTYQKGEQIATREAYGNALKRLGMAYSNIVVLDGDTKNSTFSERFMEPFPERFFECFIAEQNMVGVGVGLGTRGKIPFVSTFGAFLTRAYDQIRMAAVSMSNLKLFGSHSGVSIGEDGVSQMALEDLAMMRAVYDAVVVYPCDAVSMEKLVENLLSVQKVCYIRGSRPKTPVVYDNSEDFPIGGSKVLRETEGDLVTVVAAGVMVFEALEAHEILKKEGMSITVIDAYSIKPLDQKTLLQAARKTGDTILTVEDNYTEGGLGDAVAGELSRFGIKVHKIAVSELPHSGKPEELLEKYGLSATNIVTVIKSLQWQM